jgi:MFS family permease
MPDRSTRWYHDLTGYHWFVLAVAALGWLFDTMDQQLFVLARVPAMNELAPAVSPKGQSWGEFLESLLKRRDPNVPPDPAQVSYYGSLATSIFLMGWALGGLGFGVLGDRIGRAKTMLLTILVYSIFTGVSAFSRGFLDFGLWRFLTGLGVGGEFAVGVALVAEVMSDRARPFALGLLQALSAVGNITAALISLSLGHLEETGVVGEYEFLGVKLTAWRLMFLIGTLPALLAIVIRRNLKEPERWKALAAQQFTDGKRLGSYRDLFGDARWRRRAILGMLLTSSGVIGLWGIGFFSPDLNRSVFRKVFEEEFRVAGEADKDRDFVRLAAAQPQALAELRPRIQPADLLSPNDGGNPVTDAQLIYAAVLELAKTGNQVSTHSILEQIARPKPDGAKSPPPTLEEQARRAAYLEGTPQSNDLVEHAERIDQRAKQLRGRLTEWAAYTGIMINSGAFFGIYLFSIVTHYVGRRMAFCFSFVMAMGSTALTFWYLDDRSDVFWMVPLMGFCQLSLFGGYAIYLPELFPTRMRSTGTSFCYNVGRFVAAVGPFTFGYLTSSVFVGLPREPMRYAGLAMCSIFLLGLAVLPFLPETKGQPLPEE